MSRRLVPALLVVVFMAGCSGSKMPSLYTVRGTVLKAKQPLTNALVRLIPDDGEVAAAFTMNGLTDASGNFSIDTLEARTNKRSSGAPEGTYTVSILLPMDEKQSGGGKYSGGKCTITAGGENNLPTIDVSK